MVREILFIYDFEIFLFTRVRKVFFKFIIKNSKRFKIPEYTFMGWKQLILGECSKLIDKLVVHNYHYSYKAFKRIFIY